MKRFKNFLFSDIVWWVMGIGILCLNIKSIENNNDYVWNVLLMALTIISFHSLYIPYLQGHRCILRVAKQYVFNRKKFFRAYGGKLYPLLFYINVILIVTTIINYINS